jgi:hypothetical protein
LTWNVAGRPIGNRVEAELAGEEITGLISQWAGLVGAVKVQLQRVDALKPQLGGVDQGQPVGAAGLVEPVQ